MPLKKISETYAHAQFQRLLWFLYAVYPGLKFGRMFQLPLCSVYVVCLLFSQKRKRWRLRSRARDWRGRGPSYVTQPINITVRMRICAFGVTSTRSAHSVYHEGTICHNEGHVSTPARYQLLVPDSPRATSGRNEYWQPAQPIKRMRSSPRFALQCFTFSWSFIHVFLIFVYNITDSFSLTQCVSEAPALLVLHLSLTWFLYHKSHYSSLAWCFLLSDNRGIQISISISGKNPLTTSPRKIWLYNQADFESANNTPKYWLVI